MKLRRAVLSALMVALSVNCMLISECGEETNEGSTPLGEVSQTVMVPMPDGVHLATTVCLPQGEDGPWPALL